MQFGVVCTILLLYTKLVFQLKRKLTLIHLTLTTLSSLLTPYDVSSRKIWSLLTPFFKNYFSP